MDATFAIQPTGPFPGAVIYSFLGLIYVVVLLAFIFDPGAARWGLWFGTITTLAVAAFIGLYIFHDRSTAIVISDTELILKAPLYGRTLPRNAIQADGIKAINLMEENSNSYRPARRSNGVGLPRLQVGWFRLNNGEKAWCYITDSSSVVYIPTNEGFSVLLSAAAPAAVHAALTR